MKFGAYAFPGLIALVLSSAAFAQTEEPAKEAPIVPALTPQQVTNILGQLKELEAQIQRMRGDNLSQILQKLRTAASSDAAAMSLYEDCEKLVNVERKDVSRDEAKRQEARIERSADRRGGDNEEVKQNGDLATAIRLQLQYLILTLEAHEARDPEKILPKLQAYVQELVAQADKLRGRSLGILGGGFGGGGRGGQGGGGRNVFVEAFQLQRYLQVDNWTNQPTDFEGMWERTILPVVKRTRRDDLPAQYDARINAETAFRKGAMPEPEFVLWSQNELPALRWERAEYLFENGSSPVNALADMLKLIKDTPAHPDAPKWVERMRSLVGQASQGAASTPTTPAVQQ